MTTWLGSRAARIRAGIAVALTLSLAIPVAGQAQPPQGTAAEQTGSSSARDLFIQGSSAYRVGDYEAAVAAWSRAFEMDPRPLLLYNLGQAYERLGRLEEAVEATDQYLREASPTDSHRSDATARLASMRERLQRTGILIVTDIEGATILIDGEDRGRTPRRDPVRLSPGTHQIEVRLEGHYPFRSSLSVTGGMVADVNVTLEPLPGTVPDEAAETQTVYPTGAYYVIGGGGAAVVAGAMLGWAGSSKADDAMYGDDADANTARAMAVTGDILLFAGIGAVTGGLIWLFMGADTEEVDPSATSWRLHPVVGPGVVGADAQVRF